MKINVLFVCTANRQRSPTAADLFTRSGIVEARSCGTSPLAWVPASAELIHWADVIVCMEPSHEVALRRRFPETAGKRLHVLDIPDQYLRNDPHLVMLLRDALGRRFPHWLEGATEG